MRNSRGNIKARGGAGTPEGTAAHGEPRKQQIFPEGLQTVRRVHIRAQGKCERKRAGERNH